jgi:hypothetical protein
MADGGQRIEVPEAELWGSFREAGRAVVAQVDPLAAAEHAFGVGGGSGSYWWSNSYWNLVRSGRLAPASPEVGGPPDEVTRGYLGWCGGTKLGPGDCLRLLAHSKSLTPHGRYAAALMMAMWWSIDAMLDSLKELANPDAVAVTLASAAAMYLLLWLVPEPISKVIATSITLSLIGYLGLDLFWILVEGWKALASAVDQARSFSQMHQAAENFGRVLGPRMGQVLLLLVSHSLGKGLAAKGPSLPRFSEASVQAEKLLGVRLAAAGAVRTITLGAGVITISLASSAMAVTATSSSHGDTPQSGAGRRLDPKEIKPGMELDPTKEQIFRGGADLKLKPGELKVDPATGLAKPTHGLSLDANPEALERFGGARQIRSIPSELKIVQRGARLEHFEIVPREPMTPARFQELLNQVQLY